MNLRLIARLKAAWAAFCVDPRTVFTVTMPKAASLPVFPPEPPPPPIDRPTSAGAEPPVGL